MAWEWVGPVATAFAGALGMGFTYRTSRDALTRQHQQDVLLQVRTERRTAFTKFWSRLDEFESMIEELGSALSYRDKSGASGTEMTAAEQERAGAGLALLDASFHELWLCGGARVQRALNPLREDCFAAIKGDLTAAGWRFPAQDLRNELIQAMREDLGYNQGWRPA